MRIDTSSLLDELGFPVFVKDAQRRYRYGNRRFAALVGVAPESLAGMDDETLFGAETADRERSDDLAVLAFETPEARTQSFTTPEGQTLLMRMCKQPVRMADGSVGIFGILEDVTDAAEEIRRIREMKRGLLEAQALAHIGHWELNLRTGTLYWSDEVYRIFGLDPQAFDATYEAFLSFIHPEDVELVNRAYTESVERRSDYRITHRVVRRDGTVRHVEERCTHALDEEGNVVRSIGTVHDITERKRIEAELLLAGKIVENTTDGILVTDAEQKILSVNEAFTRISGYSEEEIIGRMPHILSSGWHSPAFYEEMWQAINTSGRWSGEIRDRKKSGELYDAEISIFVLRNEEGAVTNYIGMTNDVTERKEREELIHNLAYYDSLTELPNRVLFREKVGTAIGLARRKGERIALLYFDLDNFKHLNESMGHIVGDELLRAAAKRLKAAVRDGDTLSRQGGDEFTLMIQGFDRLEQIVHTAERMLRELGKRFEIGGREIYTSASIGISIYPDDGEDYDTLMRSADTAMYYVKGDRKNGYQFFTRKMNEETTERMLIENDLRRALERDELFLEYQPKVELRDERVYGVEALVRWNHPTMGLIRPDQFIRIAEETGQIDALGEWVLLRAMLDMKLLQQSGFEPLVCSINVSALQFKRESFTDDLIKMVHTVGIAPEQIELEITESALMQNIETMMETLQRISRQGIALSIDDFGTGYSSLNYLKRLPVQTLKIDRSFIRDIDRDADDRGITSAVLALAKSLGMHTVAEGAERREHIEVLKTLGCESVQGYFYARPMGYDRLKAYLGEKR